MTMRALQTKSDDYPSRSSDTEQWLERKDPVFWGKWTPEAPLTRTEAESFAKKGYLVLKSLFTPQEVHALQTESARLRAPGAKLDKETLITEPGSNDVRTIFQLEQQSALFNRLANHKRLAAIASFLLDDPVYIHQSRLNFKPGYAGKEFYWHSDFETWHAEDGMPRMRAISASVLLSDNDAMNGPLMLIPGSQDHFIACAGETPEDNHKSSLKKQEVGVPSQESLLRLAETFGIEYAAGDAGAVILFDCNIMHGSNSNITPFPRSNAFFVYNAMSNRLQAPFGAKNPRPAFLANRGEPKPVTLESGPLA